MTMAIPVGSGQRLLRRWLKFNFVGAMGIGVQLACVELASSLLLHAIRRLRRRWE